ncbi:MAG: hypothetical protein EOM20_01905 [Spartobacteria bacterium]|nr:hypothetical protein [Spartobacteria bacterium]
MNERSRSRGYISVLLLMVLATGVALSFFRATMPDETRYMRDAMVMAECLRAGQWFGGESVGEHGFLFKLPVALLYLVSGPSVWVATLFNVALCLLACYLAWRWFRRMLGEDAWAFWSVWMLVFNFQFLRLLPSFNRDIPLLIAALLFYAALIGRRGDWTLGICLLLVLEAKESSFYIFAVAMGIWLLMNEWDRKHPLTMLLRLAERGMKIYVPGLAWLTLMLTTNLIPINMWNASILGLISSGMNYMGNHFSLAYATDPIWEGANAIDFSLPTDALGPPSGLQAWAEKIARVIAAYSCKLFYPNIFSFTGIPKLMALPAIIMSVDVFRRWRRYGEKFAPALCLIFWAYLVTVFLRKTHARYLFPVAPLFIFFFVAFLRDGLTHKRLPWIVLPFTVLAELIGCYFDPNLKKLVMALFLLALMGGAAVAVRRHHPRSYLWRMAVPCALGLLLAAYFLQFAIRHPLGQIRNYLAFGRNRECEEVMRIFGPYRQLWLNDIGWGDLPYVYRREPRATVEWHWRLKDSIPKKYLINTHTNSTHSFAWKDRNDFRKKMREQQVRWVGFTVSTLPTHPLPLQNELPYLAQEEWLSYKGTCHLRNKAVHLFAVLPDIVPRRDGAFRSVTLRLPDRVQTNNITADILTMGDQPAEDVLIHSPQTVEFLLPDLPPDEYVVRIADVLRYEDGTPVGVLEFPVVKEITPPRVSYTFPESGGLIYVPMASYEYMPNALVRIEFSEPLWGNPGGRINLISSDGEYIKPQYRAYCPDTSMLLLAFHLKPGRRYALDLESANIRDVAGNRLDAGKEPISFTTLGAE